MTVELTTHIGPGYITAPTFEQMRFPAGEAHIKVANDNAGKGPLTEVARIYGADGNDLITLAMWADAARQRGARTVLHMPYLPGARQDRGLPFGACVYADVINGMSVDQIVCVDPHSLVMPSLLNNLTVIDSTTLVRHHVVGRADDDEQPQRYQGIIAPDKGAFDRAARVADACHLPLYRAEKQRDPATGQLSGFTCELLPPSGRFLVVDDICDGGGTFMGLAEATGLPKDRLGLYVSHGIFSGNAHLLHDHFGEIVTTDSYRPAAGDPSRLGVTPRVLSLQRQLIAATGSGDAPVKTDLGLAD
ncbi:ribose-phosphate pyrophosphokinase [Leifsonia sp. Leaf336]|uniref:ribose-phosphate pyrophosphokinase n=1 Tax=Leifsonia sp. Leaf336 TaxID=1736341 RepID=UPI000B170C19|nr:ribose-phosphate pyrophosphokinase [Leifsonia sp. Leaf336]